MVSLSCAILGLPTVGYIGDFAFLAPSSISSDGQQAFQDFIHALLVILKDINATIGPPEYIPVNPGRNAID